MYFLKMNYHKLKKNRTLPLEQLSYTMNTVWENSIKMQTIDFHDRLSSVRRDRKIFTKKRGRKEILKTDESGENTKTDILRRRLFSRRRKRYIYVFSPEMKKKILWSQWLFIYLFTYLSIYFVCVFKKKKRRVVCR